MLWLLELQIKRGRKVQTQVHTVNSNSRTSNRLCSLFSKKNPTVRIFCISGLLAVPVNPDKWSSTVYIIHSLVFSLKRPGWQEPEHSHVTGIALAHCILGKFLGVVCHCSPSPLDVPTFAARCQVPVRPQRRERF